MGVRILLTGNIAFYQRLGFEIIGESHHEGYNGPTALDLRKPVGTRS